MAEVKKQICINWYSSIYWKETDDVCLNCGRCYDEHNQKTIRD